VQAFKLDFLAKLYQLINSGLVVFIHIVNFLPEQAHLHLLLLDLLSLLAMVILPLSLTGFVLSFQLENLFLLESVRLGFCLTLVFPGLGLFLGLFRFIFRKRFLNYQLWSLLFSQVYLRFVFFLLSNWHRRQSGSKFGSSASLSPASSGESSTESHFSQISSTTLVLFFLRRFLFLYNHRWWRRSILFLFIIVVKHVPASFRVYSKSLS